MASSDRGPYSGAMMAHRLPPNCSPCAVPLRAKPTPAPFFIKTVNGAVSDDKDARYLFTIASRNELGQTPPATPRDAPRSVYREQFSNQREYVENNHRRMDAYRRPSEQVSENLWTFSVDNAFASKVVARVGVATVSPPTIPLPRLCPRCRGLDFRSNGFRLRESTSELSARSHYCDFCSMLWGICNAMRAAECPSVFFQRIGSILAMKDPYSSSSMPVLSILRSPALSPDPYDDLQLGFPVLPKAGSQTHFEIIKQWLKDCDDHHPNCRSCQPSRPPTRLIDVGNKDSPTIRLHEPRSGESCRYIALSHPWGDAKIHNHFSTTVSNIRKHSSPDGINILDLPATFIDAVKTTRELGIRYLWIDALCIIQGPSGDFEVEALRMEEVFGSAYCVIAASRATGQSDGFLQGRQGRKMVTFQEGGGSRVFLCENIDDFDRDVLQSPMESRGWVLQERVLGRRTIYFTRNQTYWECGLGVRCETLSKMNNTNNLFISDANFPTLLKGESFDTQIRFYQSLFTACSKRMFTKLEDRSVAISGLEKRLRNALHVGGGFGILGGGQNDGMFHRFLLWRRDSNEAPLQRIAFSPGRERPPSWSWMAFTGAIKYLDIPDSEEVEWARDIRPPWSRTKPKTHANGHIAREDRGVLKAVAWPFYLSMAAREEIRVSYDVNGVANERHFLCVVLGRETRGRAPGDWMHYVLIVAPVGPVCYERVGVGFIPEKCIQMDEPGQPVDIY